MHDLYEPIEEWFKWFAWYPVYTSDKGWKWFKFVYVQTVRLKPQSLLPYYAEWKRYACNPHLID